MTEIIFKQTDGQSVDVNARNGFTIMEVAVNSGVQGIDGECGGGCSCATCHIYVGEPWVSSIEPPTEYETDLLDCIQGRAVNSRLSCQIKVTDALHGVVVTIPDHQGIE